MGSLRSFVKQREGDAHGDTARPQVKSFGERILKDHTVKIAQTKQNHLL